jgi:hypothetical protein
MRSQKPKLVLVAENWFHYLAILERGIEYAEFGRAD